MLFSHSPPSPLFLFLLLLLSGFLPPSLPSPTGPSHSPLRWTSPHDPCYHLDGHPRHCLSEFINAAYGIPVLATDPPSSGGLERNVSSLTDLHNPHNLTCLSGEPWDRDWAVTIPLGRRFEITYISLQFCQQGELSEGLSISILKSMDYGHSWRPLQYYSSDCPGVFGQPPQTVALTRHQETEPLCSDPRPLQKHRGGAVLAFSTLDGRPSAADLDFSPVLQDWVTATDIRVVFHKPNSRAGKQEAGGRGGGGAIEGVLRWRAGSKGEGAGQGEKEGGGLLWGMEEKDLLKMEGESLKENKRGGERTDKASRRNGSNKSPSQEETQNTTRKEGDAMASGTPSSSRKGRGRGRKKEDHHWMPCQGRGCDWRVEEQERNSKSRELRRRRNHGEGRGSRSRQRARDFRQLPPSSLSPPPTRPPISLSDLQVGGRCKCNGHASRCRRDNQGQAVCQCEHHTMGPDCDVCKPFYYDRPWQRATPSQPHPCVRESWPCACLSVCPLSPYNLQHVMLSMADIFAETVTIF